MFLCHFPDGARSGIIAACTDARLRAGHSGLAMSNSAEHWLEAPVFDEHDQWLASCWRRFGEIASAHHASKAWRRPAYYE
jgi:hypothetical protein